EDITNFMQAINESQGQPLRHAREASGPDPEAEERALRAGAIPTSQREVGDALRAMQEQFAKSLEGLEGSRSESGSQQGVLLKKQGFDRPRSWLGAQSEVWDKGVVQELGAHAAERHEFGEQVKPRKVEVALGLRIARCGRTMGAY
ncbi:hypothetical protein EXIGLDRAFT_703412, partial [Exidia glandulosa HHB12029]